MEISTFFFSSLQVKYVSQHTVEVLLENSLSLVWGKKISQMTTIFTMGPTQLFFSSYFFSFILSENYFSQAKYKFNLI